MLSFEDFKTQFPATRNFQRFSAEQRANMAASHRLGYRQKQAIGEVFWSHEWRPDVAFSTRRAALEAGYVAYIAAAQVAAREAA